MTRQQDGSSGHYSGWWWLLIACQCAGEAGVDNKSRLRRCGLHDRSVCTLLLKSVGQGWCTDGCTVGCASLLSTRGMCGSSGDVAACDECLALMHYASPFLYMVWLLCLCCLYRLHGGTSPASQTGMQTAPFKRRQTISCPGSMSLHASKQSGICLVVGLLPIQALLLLEM